MSRILIVEDDRKIAQLESDYLESNGYETKIIEDGKKALSELKTNHYDLILLDLMLPGCSGYDICRKIRDEIDIPILMVTARTEGVDVIRGLGLGADDYITKPFDPSQLVARVRSHLKRYERLTTRHKEREEKENAQEQIKVEDVVIEPQTWRVWKAGEEVKLPHREFELLVFLAKNPNIVFSKETLFEKIWGFDYVSDAATVSVHINRLREKLEDDPRDPKNGEVIGMKCVEMELGEPDASGRRRPIVKEGSEFVLDIDTMIMALGTSPNPLIRSTTPGLDANKHGCIVTQGEDGLTSREGVYAGGDAVTGAATVILAMGAGKNAAKAIDEYIKSK